MNEQKQADMGMALQSEARPIPHGRMLVADRQMCVELTAAQ